jgi:stage III sporulation protein AE
MRINKKIFIVIMVLVSLLLFNLTVKAVTSDEKKVKNVSPEKRQDIILDQFNKLNLEDFQKEIEKINERNKYTMPQLNLKKVLIGLAKGEIDFSWKNLFTHILKYIGQEVTVNLTLIGQIIILAVISAVLRVFHNSFSSKSISETANLLIFLLLSILILQSFQVAISIGIQTVDYMVSFMQALLPILLSLLVSVGAISSAAFFHPVTFLITTFLTSVIRTIIFPLIFISCVLFIVDNISRQVKISRLAKLFREISMGLLGFILLIFVGWLLLQGGATAITDSLTLRSAKYLTGAFIPVVGGILADAVDLIVSCSLIIKNAFNFFGVLAIVLIVVYPIVKLVVLIAIYKFTSALLQPISEERLVKVLDNLANNLILVFVVVI